MRVVHYAPRADTLHVQVRCGVWGPMDTDWTEDAGGVTCLACRRAMGEGVPERAAATAPARARVAAQALARPAVALRRAASGWAQQLAGLSFRRGLAARGRP